MLIYFYLALLVGFSSLQAILDGRIAPIYLDTRYTFTDQEWARGIIHFNQGFDLPTAGTVYLNLDGGGIYNSINLNSGTIVATKTITLLTQGSIFGPGFLKCSSAVTLYHESISQRLFFGSGKIKITGPWLIKALSNSAVLDQAPGCTLDFTNSYDNITITGGTMFLRSVSTALQNPPAIYFGNIDLVTASSSISTQNIFFAGISSISAINPLDIQKLAIIGIGKVTIFPGSQISLRGLDLQFKGTRLELQNVALDFVSSTTGQINIATPYPLTTQGTISINGNCSIKSSTLNNLWLDSRINLEFYSGSQLTLEPNTQLSIIDFP